MHAYSHTELLTFIQNALKGQYEILHLIGSGGMASVYLARQLNLDRPVALKVIHPNLIHDKEFVSRFLQEARISARLSHPNIVTIYDFGETGGIYFISMEYLDGQDIASLIRDNGPLDPLLALRYVVPIVSALDYIHQWGYLHRDIKSANIIITKSGRAVLTDFGIAWAGGSNRLTITGSLLGTPEYLSPEQASGKDAVPQSDFYSLGVIMYECITGKVPYTNPNQSVVIHQILKSEPIPISHLKADVPAEIESIIMGLLGKKIHGRNVYIDSLRAYQTGEVMFSQNKTRSRRRFFQKGLLRLPPVNTLMLVLLLILFSAIMIWIVVFYTHTQQTPAPSGPQIIEETNPAPSPAGRTAEHGAANINREPEPVRQTRQPVTYREIVIAIENQLVRHEGVLIMRNYISERAWSMVMENSRTGSNQPIRGVSFSQVATFIRRLNELKPEETPPYRLPYLEEIFECRQTGRIPTTYSEWVNDPPVFARGHHDPQRAKFFDITWEGGGENSEQRNRIRSDIFFRLVRERDRLPPL